MWATIECEGACMEPETAEIARGLRQRDPALLEQLIERYQHRLLRFLWHLLRDRQAADDIFQETWLRVLERGHQYDPRWAFEAWLISIARNLAIDGMRRRNPASLDEPQGHDGEEGEPRQVAAGDPGPLEQAVRREEGQLLAEAMDTMPAYYRETLSLRFHEEMSLEEIARVQSIPLSTVKSRLHRGLALLGKRWEKNV